MLEELFMKLQNAYSKAMRVTYFSKINLTIKWNESKYTCWYIVDDAISVGTSILTQAPTEISPLCCFTVTGPIVSCKMTCYATRVVKG